MYKATINLIRSVARKNRALSTQLQTERLPDNFRVTNSCPSEHNENHLARFYTISPEDKQRLFLYGGLPKVFEVQAKTFTETCIMVRKPALQVIQCLTQLDYTKPALRFVLYGKMGTGKSLSLAHIIHYAATENFLIVHVPWLGNWMRRCKESSNSEKKEGFIDLNLDAAAWLIHFKNQNMNLLNNPEFVTTEEYVWSKREKTDKGSPLFALVDHGINRVKYASECIVFLAEEIKKLSSAGKCKTLVAIDGFNAFFYPETRIKTEKKEIVHPSKVTLTEAFLNLTKCDWNNAVSVVTVDEIAIAEKDHGSHLPRFLLGKDGFEHLDPFIPILVDGYTEKELLSCMDYFRERKWVSLYPGMDEELSFLSARNPYRLMQLCSSL